MTPIQTIHGPHCGRAFTERDILRRRVEERAHDCANIEAERDRLRRTSTARAIIIEMVRDDMERILAAWSAGPGGQQCGYPDKSIPPSKCHAILRMLGEPNAEWQYDQYAQRIADAERDLAQVTAERNFWRAQYKQATQTAGGARLPAESPADYPAVPPPAGSFSYGGTE